VNPLRLGLIGAGYWGQAYIKTIAKIPGLRLARVGSRNPATAQLVEKDCVVSTDWRELAHAGDLDGVIVCTPPKLHAQMVRSCLESGLCVLVEKPLTMDVSEAKELLELARKKKGYVLVDHIYLFHPAYIELKNRARGLGVPQLISSAGGRLGPFRDDAPPLWDCGSHDVALALDFMGENPKAAQATFRPQKQGTLIDIRLDFTAGAQARLCVGNAFPARNRLFCVRFRDQALTLDDAGPRPLVLSELDQYGRPKGEGEDVKIEKALPLTRAVEAFAAAIRSGSKDLSSLELGVAVVDVLARCEPSKQ
jgi:predicted dehydrogenase